MVRIRRVPRLRHALVLVQLACCLAVAPGAAAQRFEDSPFEEYLRPPATDSPESVPRLAFTLVSELPLPGPLPGPGPRLVGDRVEIEVAGGRALATLDANPSIRVEPGPAVPASDGEVGGPAFVVAPDGKVRCTALPSGFVLAQKKCSRCRRGWRKHWKLRVPGTAFALPVVTDRRVYFGATDNRVYCVKRRNGHRLWTRDVGGRVSRPLALWRASEPEAELFDDLTLILVVPDSGAELLALDARSGQPVATRELPENETLVGGPLALPDGRIAVARQKYRTQEASLMLFALSPLAEPPPEAATATARDRRSSPRP